MAETRTILVVDDEPDLLHAVRLYLEMEGYQVITATNGEEALEKLRTRLPDLVVLDVMMPEMNGFETLEEIRRVSNVPVIMLTVKGEESDKVRGLSLGADDYVTKPFSQRELLSRIQAVLRRAEMPPFVPAPGSSSMRTSPSTSAATRCWSRARRCSLRRPNTGCCTIWFPIRAESFRTSRCWRRFGATNIARKSITFGCTSLTCARRSSPTLRTQSTS